MLTTPAASGRPMLPLAVREGDRVLVPGDVHFPVHDPRAVDILVAAARDLRCTWVVLQGDTFDYWGLSRYPKEAQRYFEDGRLEEEASAGREALAALRASVPRGHAVIGPGNHEDRWYDLVDANPALHGFEWSTPVRQVLEGWHVLPRGYRLLAGPLVIEHGDRIRGCREGGGLHPAHRCLQNYPGQNTLFGHTHRIDACTRPTEKRGEPVAHGAWTVGYLGDPVRSSTYMRDGHSWEQGFAVVDFFALARGRLGFTVNQARFLRGARGRQVVHLLGRTWRA